MEKRWIPAFRVAAHPHVLKVELREARRIAAVPLDAFPGAAGESEHEATRSCDFASALPSIPITSFNVERDSATDSGGATSDYPSLRSFELQGHIAQGCPAGETGSPSFAKRTTHRTVLCASRVDRRETSSPSAKAGHRRMAPARAKRLWCWRRASRECGAARCCVTTKVERSSRGRQVARRHAAPRETPLLIAS
eukprot:scaffold443_cov234-Pinguiococcus_pyrenoidosus.AAC.2